jgi:ParB-like chromosome segregation protein Spo0J
MDGSGNLAIDYRPIGDLIPYARNARTHSEAQVALIAGSIREYGFTNPVLVDGENGIIAGHGRVMAARKLGLARVPVIELAHLTEAQKRAYILADNKLAEQAGWDRELLALELGDLQGSLMHSCGPARPIRARRISRRPLRCRSRGPATFGCSGTTG